MAYDVKGLEVPAELFKTQDGDCEQQLVVVSPVHCGRYWVYVHLLAKAEGVALERDHGGVDLGAEAGVARKALDGVGQAAGQEIAVGRVDFSVFQLGYYSGVELRLQVGLDKHPACLQANFASALKELLLPLEHPQAHIRRAEAPGNADEVFALCGAAALGRQQGGLPHRAHAYDKSVLRRRQVQFHLVQAMFLCGRGNAFPKFLNLREIQFGGNAKIDAQAARMGHLCV